MVSKFLWQRVHCITLEVANHIVHEEDGKYRSIGNDPQFTLRSSQCKLPCRWVIISYLAEGQDVTMDPVLYIDNGRGFSEQCTMILPRGNGRIEAIVRLPDQVQAIRLDPPLSMGVFSLRDMKIIQINSFIALWRLVKNKLENKQLTLQRLQNIKGKLLKSWKKDGFFGLKSCLATLVLTQQKSSALDYQDWINAYDTITDFDRKKIHERIKKFKCRPLISIIMPVYYTNEKWLRLTIDSILAQLYPEWELCIADDGSNASSIRHILEEYQSKCSKIKVIFQKSQKKNAHASLAFNAALELATGEWISLLGHCDKLPEHALYMVAEEIIAFPQARLIYSDEDRIDQQGIRCNPYFKSNWNPDLFLSHNMISHLAVYHGSLVKEVNGFRQGIESDYNYDLALRIVEKITTDQIRHIPHILYHWRIVDRSIMNQVDAKNNADRSAKMAIQDHLNRQKIAADVIMIADNQHFYRIVYKLPNNLPKVSIVIPTRDGLDLLRVAVQGVLEKTDYPNLELIIVDNQSKDQETLAYLKELEFLDRVRVIRYDAPYNYSAINNVAVRCSMGEIIALVNNDIEVISRSWLREMVSHALRPEIGAVGALLYYANDTIQHAGVLLCPDRVALHAHQHLNRGDLGHCGRASLVQNFSAVTAACMVLRRAVFDSVEGLDEENLAIAYNDIDLCLRIQEQGYRILWTPYAELYHHESASLGPPEAPERREQFLRESAYLKMRWGQVLAHDPFYNPNLTLNGGDYSLAFPPLSRKFWQINR